MYPARQDSRDLKFRPAFGRNSERHSGECRGSEKGEALAFCAMPRPLRFPCAARMARSVVSSPTKEEE